MKSSSGTWTLRDGADNKYAFTSAGLISSLTDVNGYAEDFTDNSSNQVTTITDAVSGRALTLTWSKPTGATSLPRVVGDDAPADLGRVRLHVELHVQRR